MSQRMIRKFIEMWLKAWIGPAFVFGLAYLLAKWATTPPTPVHWTWMPTAIVWMFVAFHAVWYAMVIAACVALLRTETAK